MENKTENMLVQIEKISTEATKCNLDFQNRMKNREAVRQVMRFFDISFVQAVLFSCIVEISLERVASFEVLSRFLKCSVLKVIGLIDDIELLEKKNIIKKRLRHRGKPTYGNVGYFVPHNVIETLRTSNKTFLEKKLKLKFPNLLEEVKKTVKERDEEIISTDELIEEIQEFIQNNKEYTFVKFINKHLAKTTNKCLVLVLAYYHFTGIMIMDVESIPDAIFDDLNDEIEFKRTLASGSNELVQSGLVTIRQSEFANDQVILLSPKTIKVLYKEYPEFKIEESTDIDLTNPDKLISKKLFFEPNLNDQIQTLERILTKKNFKTFQDAADNNKLSKGVTVLFYGRSGTGKTEAVYQIAKKTNREIMKVDLSQTRSKWFGESEKQVAKIFEEYYRLVNNKSHTPILFINEVDGLFSKRLSVNGTSESSSLTWNTMQNIILEALENFEGILIATTNLTENLDKAFERRFLYKIDFKEPNTHTRQKIWKSKLPELTSRMAKILAEKYDLTGSQIDNQIRQLTLKKVLDKELDTFNFLMESCAKENSITERRLIRF